MFDRHTLLTATVLLGLVLPQSACTLIGYGVGSAIDAGSRHSLAPQRFAPSTLKPGRKIRLKLRDGSAVDGAYTGIEQLPPEEYAARYAAARERHLTVVPLPELGDTATLCMRGTELDVEFLGFDRYRVLVRELGRAEPEHVRPQRIAELRGRGDASASGEVLALLISEGALPFHSAVAMQMPPAINAAGGKRLVPLDQIDRMEWKSSTGRTVGLVIGGMLDLTVLAIAVACSATDCYMGGWGSGPY